MNRCPVAGKHKLPLGKTASFLYRAGHNGKAPCPVCKKMIRPKWKPGYGKFHRTGVEGFLGYPPHNRPEAA